MTNVIPLKGELPEWAVNKIASAHIVQLELWAEMIFEVQNLEQLFL